jgi:hypothetical protein
MFFGNWHALLWLLMYVFVVISSLKQHRNSVPFSAIVIYMALDVASAIYDLRVVHVISIAIEIATLVLLTVAEKKARNIKRIGIMCVLFVVLTGLLYMVCRAPYGYYYSYIIIQLVMTVAFCAKLIYDKKTSVLISLIAITKLGSDFFAVKFFYDYILIRAIGIVLLLIDVLYVIGTIPIRKKKTKSKEPQA